MPRIKKFAIESIPELRALLPNTNFCYNQRMNSALKITKIGNSAGVILPRDVLAHLNVQVGETLSLVTTPGGIELRAASPDFEAQMAAARQVMLRRKRALRELAK
jgi:putative addiction module antidote